MIEHAEAPETLDEEALVEALKAGEERAYEQLIRRNGGRLLSVARRFVGAEEARDVVQETFLSAFRAIDRFDSRARLGTWLHRIAVNAALMRLRKKSAQLEESIEPLLPTFLDDGHLAATAVPWSESPEAMAQRGEVRRRVHRAIDRLPPSYRGVLLLRDIEELSGAETAELLGISPGAVKVRLHRARQALRELLDSELRKEVA